MPFLTSPSPKRNQPLATGGPRVRILLPPAVSPRTLGPSRDGTPSPGSSISAALAGGAGFRLVGSQCRPYTTNLFRGVAALLGPDDPPGRHVRAVHNRPTCAYCRRGSGSRHRRDPRRSRTAPRQSLSSLCPS